MKEFLEEYCQWMEARNYAQGTVQNGRLYIGRCIDWLAERGVMRAQDVTRPMLERYQRVLFHHRKADGQPLSFAGQHVRLTTIQGWLPLTSITRGSQWNRPANMMSREVSAKTR